MEVCILDREGLITESAEGEISENQKQRDHRPTCDVSANEMRANERRDSAHAMTSRIS